MDGIRFYSCWTLVILADIFCGFAVYLKSDTELYAPVIHNMRRIGYISGI